MRYQNEHNNRLPDSGSKPADMPSLVQDFVCRSFKYLNDLQVMVDDINFAERINQLGDERIDKPGWLKFRERVNSELEKRKVEQNA